MTTNDSSRYVLLTLDERQLLASAARGVSQALGVVPGSALMWGPFADAARTLEKQAEHGTPVTDEAVERAAIQMCATGRNKSIWAILTENERADFRKDARAVLNEAFGGRLA